MHNKQGLPFDLATSDSPQVDTRQFLVEFAKQFAAEIRRPSSEDLIARMIVNTHPADFLHLLSGCFRTAYVTQPEYGVSIPSFMHNCIMNILLQRLSYAKPLPNDLINRIASVAIPASSHFRESLLRTCETIFR